MDEEAPTLNSEKLGWVTKRLGFTKDKGSSSRRRVIRWEPERVEKLARQYGLALRIPLSQGKPFNPFEPFELALTAAKGSGSSQEPFEKPFEPEPVSEAKGLKGSKGFLSDKENSVTQALGMSIEQALGIWTAEGKPVIHLGPGENCFDLERLLSHRDINSRHLEAIRNWLAKKSERET